MTPEDQAAASERLRRALLAFKAAQQRVLETHRQLKGLQQAELNAFWVGSGRRIEIDLRATAAAVVVAFRAFSAAGLVACASDRHAVTQAARHLREAKPKA